ncbi:MAG: hypothetical protein RL447_767 [Bacteroidota bacterium]
MQKLFHRLALLSCLLFFSVSVLAQDDPLLLSEVSLTAHGNQQSTRQTGRNVWVIPGSLLSRSPVHSIDDLLRFIPGVEVQQRGPQGVQGDLLIRGGTFQQVLVLIDGVRLNDPLTGHFNAYIPIDPSEIDRIEILKGPAAAIWGSEAVGGVIHVFTKTFSEKRSPKKISLQSSIGTGAYQLWQAQVRAALQQKNDRFSLSANSRNSDGAPQRGTRGYFQLNTIQAAWQHDFQKGWKLKARTAWDGRDFGAQNFYTGFVSDTATEMVNSWWNHLQINKATNKGIWQADLSYKQTLDIYRFRPAAVANRNEMGLAQFQLRYQGGADHALQYQGGIQAFQRSIQSNDRGNHRIEQFSLFGTAHYQFNTEWNANGGLRATHDELYGTILIPQLSLSYAPAYHNFRFSAGRSFRDADFTERYNNYNKTSVSSGRIGNPSLSPEDAWQAEFGYDINIQKKFYLHTSIFYRDHKGLIDWVNTPYANMPRQINLIPTGIYALAKNVDRVKTIGWEADLQYRDSIGNGRLLAQLGILWLDNQAPNGGAGIYLNSHARFLMNGLVEYRIGKWSGSIGGLYKKRSAQTSSPLSTTLTPSYFLMNIKLVYAGRENRFAPYLQADNLFNTRYSDLLGAPMPGRWLSGGFQVTL